ncbi:MAG: hypothetical protein RLZZ330_751, partial [Actinomycetota bacterium]
WWSEKLNGVEIDTSSLENAIRSLPLITREDVQHNSLEMQALLPNSNREDYALQKTSGSTSKPIQLIKHIPTYFKELDAIALLEWKWHNRVSEAVFGAFRLGVKDADHVSVGPPYSYVDVKEFAFQRSSVDATPEELLDAIAKYKPNYLLTNPVSLRLAIHEQLRNPREIYQIEQILTLADRVDTSLRELAREVFGAKIVDRYSTVEFGYIALQCPFHEHLHVVSPSVFVEILDENNEPCPVGVPGRVVVTGLHTFANPLFRYEQGDVAQWGEPCDAGITWPVIEEVHGRLRTITNGPDGKQKLVTLFGADFMLIRTIMDYMVVKFEDSVAFLAQVREPLTLSEQDRIRKSMQDIFRYEVPVHFKITGEPLGERTYKAAELFIVAQDLDQSWDIATIRNIANQAPQTFY